MSSREGGAADRSFDACGISLNGCPILQLERLWSNSKTPKRYPLWVALFLTYAAAPGVYHSSFGGAH